MKQGEMYKVDGHKWSHGIVVNAVTDSPVISMVPHDIDESSKTNNYTINVEIENGGMARVLTDRVFAVSAEYIRGKYGTVTRDGMDLIKRGVARSVGL